MTKPSTPREYAAHIATMQTPEEVQVIVKAVQQALVVRLEETTQRANAFIVDVREDLRQRREETLPEQ
jgi:protein associated with RNAse G/E